MSDWIKGEPQVATEEHLSLPWGGSKENFRCYLCGHSFKVGDYWRWVYATGVGCMNFITCEECDGEDVLGRWVAANAELRTRFWWADRYR